MERAIDPFPPLSLLPIPFSQRWKRERRGFHLHFFALNGFFFSCVSTGKRGQLNFFQLLRHPMIRLITLAPVNIFLIVRTSRSLLNVQFSYVQI